MAQVRRSLTGTETTPELESDLAALAAELLADRLGPWLRGAVVARPQSADGVTLTRPLRREDGRLDPTKSAPELERQVRAYQPWPGSFVDTPAGRLVIWSARVAGGGDRASSPGAFDQHGLVVGSGERLTLVDVQPAGGNRMSWTEYVRGRPAIVGSSVVSGPR